MKTYTQDGGIKNPRPEDRHPIPHLAALSRSQRQFDFDKIVSRHRPELLVTKGCLAGRDLRILLAGFEMLYPANAMVVPVTIVLEQTIMCHVVVFVSETMGSA